MVNEHCADYDFNLLRNDRLAGFARYAAGALSSVYRIRLEGGENLPGEGPALLLPKHNSAWDIPIHGVVLHRETKRYANYIMRKMKIGNSLLEKLGGIIVIRKADIRKVKDRGERKRFIEEVKSHNNWVWEYVKWLYSNDELVVSYPEGRVGYGSMGKLETGVIEKILEFQREIGIEIPIIPIGTEYKGFVKIPELKTSKQGKKFKCIPKPPVVVRAGKPIIKESDILKDRDEFEDFVRELRKEIANLSGLEYDC
jgi:1-acyl-sn-glycerol-3-phosphate acyltransferase